MERRQYLKLWTVVTFGNHDRKKRQNPYKISQQRESTKDLLIRKCTLRVKFLVCFNNLDDGWIFISWGQVNWSSGGGIHVQMRSNSRIQTEVTFYPPCAGLMLGVLKMLPITDHEWKMTENHRAFAFARGWCSCCQFWPCMCGQSRSFLSARCRLTLAI